ncbi:hypothetical protein PL418_01480 [Barnesiella intestinihominis]|uniref:hypothetical protein n=1 Tax=Barnesiella intestinihominis TaxID=487174 RepID=UPI001897BEE6|nr:hypothetical protein [Barnesiella intestinihominis]MDB0680244.1 hypothetical protein [Barnesiella intestinihominis]
MHTIIPETAATAQPVQCATIDESQIASAASVTAQPTISHELLYTPAEAARIVYHLTDGYFDPGYILLFGKLVGDTPHRDAAAYNLVVVREIPSCGWFHNQCILHYKIPCRHRKITYINLFILPLNYGIEPHDVPLFRLCQW